MFKRTKSKEIRPNHVNRTPGVRFTWYNIIMKRKVELVQDQIYHIFSRSIAEYVIFNDALDYQRMLYLIIYFQIKKPPTSFSTYLRLEKVQYDGFINCFAAISQGQTKIVQIISYCLMPTHIHLTLKQLVPNGISIFMSNVLNSYTRYFNTMHHRKGPLWESKFQNVIVAKDEQLLHLTRYQHLNPVTAHLVNQPQDWHFSSYNEYINQSDLNICEFNDILDINPKDYKKFVQERISYQRELAKIKKILLESP